MFGIGDDKMKAREAQVMAAEDKAKNILAAYQKLEAQKELLETSLAREQSRNDRLQQALSLSEKTVEDLRKHIILLENKLQKSERKKNNAGAAARRISSKQKTPQQTDFDKFEEEYEAQRISEAAGAALQRRIEQKQRENEKKINDATQGNSEG